MVMLSGGICGSPCVVAWTARRSCSHRTRSTTVLSKKTLNEFFFLFWVWLTAILTNPYHLMSPTPNHVFTLGNILAKG